MRSKLLPYKYGIFGFYILASGSLLVREMFGAKITRTGSIAPSVRQKMSRKAESPFAAFGKRMSRKLTAKQVCSLFINRM